MKNDISRRRFLTTSAVLAGSALSARSWKAVAASTGPNSRVRVGLIGCGGMGLGDIKTFFFNQEVDCPIVCDVDDAHIGKAVEMVQEQRGHAPDTVKDFRRVIDRKDLDAVLVCTPDHWHALPAIYACESGKDVYVEKPLGKTIGEGRAMLNAARHFKRVVQMGTQWRSSDHYRDAVEFVQSGQIGKVRQVRAWAYLDWVGGIGNPPDGAPPAGVDYDMWLGPAPLHAFNPNRFHFNFRWYWDYAGGLMTDWGVHLLNICLWAMGREVPLRVSSFGGKRVVKDNSETPDTQVTVYDFPSYNLIFEHQMLGGVGIGGRPHGMSFSGSEGTLTIDAQGWEVVREKSATLVPFKKPAGKSDGRPEHVRNFLDCMGSRQDPVENLDLGHYVSTIAQLGNLAFRTQREIRWDAAKETVHGNREANALVHGEYRRPWKLPKYG